MTTNLATGVATVTLLIGGDRRTRGVHRAALNHGLSRTPPLADLTKSG